MNLRVTTCDNAADALKQAAIALTDLLRQDPKQRTLFLSSGGSSLSILDMIPVAAIQANLTVTVSDDRYSYDPTVNNFAQLMAKPFYQTAEKRGCHFIDTRPNPDESLEAAGERFDQALRGWVEANPNGRIIMTQGIGPDRHTCGMLPHPEAPARFHELFQRDKVWAVGYDGTGKNEFPLRVTITMPFLLRHVDATVVYACGEAKREAIEAALADPDTSTALAATPARVLRDMKRARLFTDLALSRHD